MIDFLKWFLFALILGWISLPLTWRLFSKLPSRGYYLTKPLGLLTWGFLHWMMVSLGLMKNTLAAQMSVLIVLILINGAILYFVGWRTIWLWISENKKIIIATETVFLAFFVLWTIVRAANPDIIHTEKFMEIAFINGILRSTTFPPMDPWLSGYGISYYYFGYVLSAMLIRITDVSASIGYNLVSSFWFGLTAIGAFGLLSDLIHFSKSKKSKDSDIRLVPKKVEWIALIAPIMLLIVSNWFGSMDVMHSRGIALQTTNEGQVQGDFWKSFKIPELQNIPKEASWRPNRGGWSWWQASRVLRDQNLNSQEIEVIDEFPQFTFLLSDIHPHMLGMPFVLLAIAQALNAIKGGWEPQSASNRFGVKYDLVSVLVAGISLGGIAFMNTWDFPFYLALLTACLVYRRYQENGWGIRRIFEFFAIIVIGAILSILLYLPFYLSFASQAGGILPSLAFFTPGKNFWVMFGPLLVPIMGYLFYSFFNRKAYKHYGLAVLLTLSLFFILFVFSWGLGWLHASNETSGNFILGLQGAPDLKALMLSSIAARLKEPGTALTLFLVLSFALALLLDKKAKSNQIQEDESAELNLATSKPSHRIFIVFLILIGALLTLAPEFVYLRDQFSWRMNTIFKFYFQAWILWSLAASYAIVFLFKQVKNKNVPNAAFIGVLSGLGITGFAISIGDTHAFPAKFGTLRTDWIALFFIVLFIIWIVWHLVLRQYEAAIAIFCLFAVCGGIAYPKLEIMNKTESFKPHMGYSLDGKRVFRQSYPDAMLAAEWLEKAPVGVMAEAVADQGGSYTTHNLISAFSGMPSVLGWVGHEHQWRGGGNEVGTRQQDLRELYNSKNSERVFEIIEQYNIRYIVFGNYEREVYRVTEPLFTQLFDAVFKTESVMIYEVRH